MKEAAARQDGRQVGGGLEGFTAFPSRSLWVN